MGKDSMNFKFSDTKQACSVRASHANPILSGDSNADVLSSNPKNDLALSLKFKENLRHSIAFSDVNYDWKFENQPKEE